MTRIVGWVAVAMTWVVAAKMAGADPCDDALQKFDASSPHTMACPQLLGLDRSMRACSATESSPRTEKIGVARLALSVALPRCWCTSAPDVGALERRFGQIHTAFDLAKFEPDLATAQACASRYPGLQQRLNKLDGELKQLRNGKRYCSAPGLDFDQISQTAASSCGEARLQRAAYREWLTCSNTSPASDPRFEALGKREAKVCSSAPPPLTCDATLAIANRLQRSKDPADGRLLWNLVATRMIAAAGARATPDDRECATRIIATVVPDDAIAERGDHATVLSLVEDPQLRGRFVEKLSKALKDAKVAEDLAKLLDGGADIEQVLLQAAKLSEDEQRRFFSVAGGLGRALQALRAMSAFEQTSRSFDLVIAPELKDCKYAEFFNVLLAGISKAVPARIAHVDRARLSHTVDELIQARMRSCTPQPTTNGPGCGAVIVVPIEDRPGERAAGSAQLHFVMPDGKGGALHRQTTSIQIPEFQAGCSASTDQSKAALRLVFELQFAFATNPREAPVVLDAMRTDVCGLRPLPPSHVPSPAYDGKGLRIQNTDLVPELAGPAESARQMLRAWKDSVGDIDANSASASLQFSSHPYSDPQGNQGKKLAADLMLHDQRAASFATVVLDDPTCLASSANRFVEAGRVIGNQAGSYLAFKRGNDTSNRRRWIVPIGFAVGEAALVAGGLYLIKEGVDLENRAVADGLDQAVPNNRLAWGRGLLVTAAVGALLGGIYAAIR